MTALIIKVMMDMRITTMFNKRTLGLALIVLLIMLLDRTAQGQEQAIGRLTIPAIGIDNEITEIGLARIGRDVTWDTSRLGTGIAHLAGQGWITQASNYVLAGHYDLEDRSPGAFYRLSELVLGDTILFTLTDGAQRVYSIDTIRVVEVNDLTPLYPSNEDRLTLLTCYNFDGQTYTQRLIVTAVRTQ